MIERIIIAGAGGQGIMLLGKVLAQAAMQEGKFVTWLPAYGAEVRGGSAYCMVVVSDQEIGSPCIGEADTLIAMNSVSKERFFRRLKKGGLLLENSSLIKSQPGEFAYVLAHPFTDIALELGDMRMANIVALGCFLRQKKIVKLESALEAISEIAPAAKKDLVSINQQALKKGAGLK